MNAFIKLLHGAILTLATTFSANADERVDGALLYCVAQNKLIYNAYREAPFAADVAIDDQTGAGVVDVASLTSALGVSPDLKEASLGDVVGGALGDAFYADLTLKEGSIRAIRLTKRVSRPNVGVPWTNGTAPSDVQRVIANALLRYGARATLMAQVIDDASCEKIMEPLDGIFMPGGVDVNPKLYGEEPYAHGSVDWNDARDVSDALVCRWAIDRNLPAIWVCRGVQILNVSLGGALIQDVASYLGKKTLEGEFSLEQVKPLLDGDHTPSHFRVEVAGLNHRGGVYHRLGDGEKGGIDPNSLLYEIVGRRTTLPFVYSSHHQAADPARIGKGLTIVATAEDGIVEALEYRANDFALGLQTHVEYDAIPANAEDAQKVERAEFAALFFNALVENARRRADARR